ncbi:hypothetical protein TVAG_352910 [Trichomonas vaginalis G3]|uniref:Uncharacterized protein n=1 Tax=Trichomonas vaginalis (strain ATCC PRA-98 / G3) TaxID=412133 RepID=A2GBQ7_TRIV3|nr:hypothetical protein TVAG_352910 [Trichomonas vaginalis G3]|eukprot:XP_001298337.1 hypothetical protein [Trichomonas vaginalis G3]
MSNRQRTTSSTRSSQASGTRNSQTPRSSQAFVQNPCSNTNFYSNCAPFTIRKGTCCNRANSSSSTGKRDSG